jgi:RNA polymerase sigma-70 factor (ECF subfamily)
MVLENPESDRKTEEFIRLLMSSQHRIYAFILTLVPHTSDADDILQETSAVMWRKYSEFKTGTDFVAWGIRIAHNKVLEFRRNRATRSMQFSQNVCEMMVRDCMTRYDLTQVKLDALDNCISKLKDGDRSLVRERYEQNYSIKELAQKLNCPLYTVYRAIGRIHDMLIRCMRQFMGREGLE